MASQAFGSFEYNLVDVDRLIETHGTLHNGAPGKKGLGHITRSGVVMLCASWELYIEKVLQEAAIKILADIASVDQLPEEVRRQISAFIKMEKHDLAPLRLAGIGWRDVYSELVRSKTAALNTPKSARLIPLFTQLIGLEDIAASWSNGIQDLDDFVGVRGDIAHQGRHAAYDPIGKVQFYRNQIRQYSVETDNCVAMHVKAVTGKNKPWNAVQ